MEKCKICNEPKVTYYREWCPRCEKPKEHHTSYLNLLEAMYYIDRVVYNETDQDVNPPGKRDLWSLLCDYSYIKNDSFAYIDFSCILDDCDDDQSAIKTYIEALINTFNLKKERSSMLWEISW